MNFPISFYFDKNVIYIIIRIISMNLFYYYNYDFIILKDLIDLILLISFIISIICFLYKKKYSEADDQYKINIKEYLYVILIYILFNIIPFLVTIRFYHQIRIYFCYSNMIFIGILLVYYFQKNQLYKHQILSFNFLFLIIFFDLYLYINYYKESLFYFISNTIVSSLFYYSKGIIRGYFKYIMNDKFIDPYFISAIDSGINLIKNLLSHGYYYFIANQNKKNKFFQKYSNDKIYEMNYLVLLIYSLTGVLNPIFDILVCYYYSPFHQCVCDIISNSLFLLTKHEFSITNLIFVIINIFFSCVSSEIIILQFCNLDKDTKKKISERGEKNRIVHLMKNFDEISNSITN